MLKNGVLGGFLLAATLSATFASATQLFELRLEKFAKKSEPLGCQTAMQGVAATFSAQSGLTPFSTGCREDRLDRDFLEGVISYFSEAPLKTLSSVDHRGFFDAQGSFRSTEECQAALADRVLQFQRIFGVQTLAAWCFREYSSPSFFTARIAALGESPVQAVATGFDFYGRPILGADTVIRSLSEAAELMFPGHVVDVSMESRLAYLRATLRYFHDERIYLHNLDEIIFSSAEICQDNVSMVEAMFVPLAARPASVFCSADGLSGIRLNLVTFSTDLGEPDLYEHYQDPARFADRAQCLQKAAAIVPGNSTILGAVCSDSTPVHLHIFLRKD